jgi:hypothetical protein
MKTRMKIRKVWLDEEYYAFVISDNDQRCESPTSADIWIGRKGFGDLVYAYGTTQDFSEITEKAILSLHSVGYFDSEIESLARLD